jgi:hypothetical protein
MIEVKLKLHPEGGPKEFDGLVWGGTEPVQFRGMAAKLDEQEKVLSANAGLIGPDDHTYLFKPICYDHPSCFVPRRFNRVDEPETYAVLKFPESMPVSIIRLERLGTPAEESKVEELQNRKPFRISSDKKGRKIEYTSKAPKIDRQKMEQMAEETESQRLEVYLANTFKEEGQTEEIKDMVKSIRYVVEYVDGERLFLSGLERVPWRVPDMEKIEQAKRIDLANKETIKDRIVFAGNFAKVYIGNERGKPAAKFAKAKSKALSFLFDKWKQEAGGWVPEADVCAAVKESATWDETRRVKVRLIGWATDKIDRDQKWIIDKIVEEHPDRKVEKVRLSAAFQYADEN